MEAIAIRIGVNRTWEMEKTPRINDPKCKQTERLVKAKDNLVGTGLAYSNQ